jgi:hypothetical protein
MRDLSEQLLAQHEYTIEILRKRIDAAIIRAERATVFGLTIEGDILCVFARDLDDVVKILRGNSPTIPESSRG